MTDLKKSSANNLIKAMKKDKPGFFYLKKILPGLSEPKLTEGVLNGPQMRAILIDFNFKSTLNQKEKLEAWNAFQEISTCFSDIANDPECKKVIKELMIAYKALTVTCLREFIFCILMGIFPTKSSSCHQWTWWAISSRYCHYGENISRKKYHGF